MGYRPRRSNRKNNTTQRLAAIIVTLVVAIATGGVGSFGGCAQLTQLLPGALNQRFSNAASVSTLGDIPAYSGSATVYINADTAHPQGTPAFTLEEISRAQSGAFTEFSRLPRPLRSRSRLPGARNATHPTAQEHLACIPQWVGPAQLRVYRRRRSLQPLPLDRFLPLRRK